MRNNRHVIAQWLTNSSAHFIFGLDAGLLVFLLLAFLFRDHLSIKTTNSLLNPVTSGVAVPMVLSMSALGLGWWRPLAFLKSGDNIWLLLILLAFLAFPWSILMAISLIAGSGYC